MILAATDDNDNLALLTVDREIDGVQDKLAISNKMDRGNKNAV